MKRDDLIKLLAWRLGDRKDVAERAIAELDYVQQYQLEENSWLPWFLETEFAGGVSLVEDRRLPLPADFLQEIADSPLYLDTDGGLVGLTKGSADILLKKYPGSGQPCAYAISGEYFLLFPQPDAAYTLGMRYYGKDAKMSAENLETKWLKYAAPVVLSALGAILAGKHYQNPQLSSSFETDLASAWGHLLGKHTAMQEVNHSRSLGGNS